MPAIDPMFGLHQTRDYTLDERSALNMRLQSLLWTRSILRRFKLLHYLNSTLTWTFAIACGLAIEDIRDVPPPIALTIVLAGLGALVCWVIRRRMSRHYRERHCVPDFTAGDRYRLDATEMHHLRKGLSFTCTLGGIKRLVNEEHYLVALLPYNYSLLLAKAAFADQDADGFCTELEHRWKQSRGQNA